MKAAWILVCLAFGLPALAQQYGDGCSAALDRLTQVKEVLRENLGGADLRLLASKLKTATDLCDRYSDIWYFRSLLERRLGNARDADYCLRKAKDAGLDAELARVDPFAPVLPAAGSVSRPPRSKYALVVGVGTFQDPGLQRLRYAAADAKLVADTLADARAGRFSPPDVHVVSERDATLRRVKQEIGWLRETAREDDLVVVYIASHGSPRDDDPRGVSYIYLHDTDVSSGARRYATSLQMADLVRELTREVKASRIVLILDACYSGSATAAEIAGRQHLLAADSTISEALEKFKSGSGHAVIASASAGQLSYEGVDAGHGYFTLFFAEALRQRGGEMPLAEVFGYVRERTAREVEQAAGAVQTPVFVSSPGAGAIVIGMPSRQGPVTK
jgi:hypothetical protein